MKHKTIELTGRFLDAAVALAEDRFDVMDNGGEPLCYARPGDPYWTSPGECASFEPSEDWSDGGPIIEREHISLHPPIDTTQWGAVGPPSHTLDFMTGPTPLIAAMRAYVASKFGEEIDLP